jgi:hypothetical protein
MKFLAQYLRGEAEENIEVSLQFDRDSSCLVYNSTEIRVVGRYR